MALAFRNVGHSFGDHRVLSGVSLEARQGEILCLLGPSGSGKTTLLRLAAGLEALQEGSIDLGGALLAAPGRDVPPEKRSFGMVFQDHALFPHLTVAENVAFGLAGRPKEQARQVVAERLASVGLAGFEDRYPHTLSGGQQQRVALARALAPSPAAMLLDEPFASVDVTRRRALREEARRALKAAGVITLVVTHDPVEAMEIADRIAVMEKGRIAQCATPEELYARPASALVASLFGEAQRFPATVFKGEAVTAYGPVPAENFADGTAVEVIVRPEAVTLAAAESGQETFNIADIRFLGRDWLVLLTNAQSPMLEPLRARVSTLEGLETGAAIALRFDPCGTFIFAA
ncbi:ABC transporter related [Parvibaculum lavamentivorans DS-1]|uniref:ABC transporter related n=1 Tax=Parvibaculum lavamentivorans (strain DS-1 / DSM 13023 / NCIMB 13966) TaxID=402881 RepID=A7HPG8_PARL1|nr:ABC transporter ATP-binding protein [Parvibaculum lavamentivorans]ABS61801.1 ABC transporter related [Parvibaculum lavamentivorans DS-1]